MRNPSTSTLWIFLLSLCMLSLITNLFFHRFTRNHHYGSKHLLKALKEKHFRTKRNKQVAKDVRQKKKQKNKMFRLGPGQHFPAEKTASTLKKKDPANKEKIVPNNLSKLSSDLARVATSENDKTERDNVSKHHEQQRTRTNFNRHQRIEEEEEETVMNDKEETTDTENLEPNPKIDDPRNIKITIPAHDENLKEEDAKDHYRKKPTGEEEQGANTRKSEPKKKSINAPQKNAHESKRKHRLAGLSCEKYGGPSDDIAAEMVYWRDIPSDSNYKSPFYDEDKYLTFEPDQGGWNNIRMAMETILVMAHAMGRTLVLPPAQRLYLLDKDPKNHKTEFSFLDFFHFDSIHAEHPGLNIISMDEFLSRVALSDRLKDWKSNEIQRPPNEEVHWDGKPLRDLWKYLRNVGHFPSWKPWKCMASFPASKDPRDAKKLKEIMKNVTSIKPMILPEHYVGKPAPVNAPTTERLKENLATRQKLCIYNEAMQNAPLIHLYTEEEDSRLLTPFYSFVFFQDWKQDLWTKRFVRDHVRYRDEIMCASARIIQALREKSRRKNPKGGGGFDGIHVRRGEFQFKETRLDAEVLYNQSKSELQDGGILYIATDESNKTFFDPFKEHFDVYFLDDFLHLLGDINVNYYGMLDQLITTKSTAFFGTWWSTFSSYINRLRGYHVTKNKMEGYEDGTMRSWYFDPVGIDRRNEMRVYWPVRIPLYMREFPTSWRDIDLDVA